MQRIKIRECTQFDKDMWIELNKEYMEFEANESVVWNYVKKASERDLDEVFDEARRNKDMILLLMIEFDGFSVGFINVLRSFNVWSKGKILTIDDMYIKEEFRDQGLGSVALKYLEDYAKENGYKRIQALGNKTNRKSNTFYEAKKYLSTDMNLFMKYFDE